MSYASLHCHDEYSNVTTGLDSINKLENMVAYCRELGLKGMALTNHDNLSSIWKVNQLQKKLREEGSDFKLIFGNEIYLLKDWDPTDTKPRKYPHFILIAKDKIGFDALLKLSSKAWYRSQVVRGKRRVVTLYSDLEEIVNDQVRGHIIGMSACLGGSLPQSYLNDRPKEGQEFLDWCVKVFGYDDFYVELQSSAIPDQTKWNNIIAEQLFDKYQTTITTDVHYTRKEDFDALEAFLRSTNESREVKEFYDAAYIQSEDEIREYLHYLPKEIIDKSLENTRKIADQVEFFDLSQKFHIPKVNVEWLEWDGPTLEEYPVISELLKSRDIQTNYCLVTCLEKLREINKFTPEYLERLEHEFDVFKWQSEELNDNFFAYFNNMQYYLNLSWEVGCAVGPSRGSASGSLLCYLMGIVQCDPVERGLYFWRFANRHRASVLDVDLDFDPVHRPKLIEAIRKERGELGITAVAAFKTLTLRAAIGNACRGYKSKEFPNGIDSDIAAYLSSLVEVQRGFVANLKQSVEGDEVRGFKKNTQLINEIRKYPGLFEMIQIFEGLITNSSTHAAAVIFFDLENDPITNHCSLMRSPNGDLCTALDLHDAEPVGCIKYDYLALSTLSIMTATFQLLQKDGVIPKELSLKECYRTYIDPNKIDYTNPEIWKHLKVNDVLSIFQWDQPSGRKGIMTTQPNTLDELTVANGLIRLINEEGQESQLDRFVRIKDKPQSFEDEMREAGLTKEQRRLMHEELDRYHGCCAMQESFMLLSQKIAGYSQAEADKLRKIVAKKNVADIEKQREFFVSKLAEQGTTEQRQIDYLWSTIIAPSLGYGFSLNHSLPYSIIGIQCILLGAVLFDPIYWQTACLLERSGSLSGDAADYNKIAKAVAELRQQGVKILPPNINLSQKEFTLNAKRQTIYYGFDALKGVDTATMNKIFEMRPFEDPIDFFDRVNPKVTAFTALIKAGAFDEMGDRESLINFAAETVGDTKGLLLKRITAQNYLRLSREGFMPDHTADLDFAKRVFNFTHYLKKLPQEEGYWVLNERAEKFLWEISYPNDGLLHPAEWKEAYDLYMEPMKEYISEHKVELLNKVNAKALREWREKYFSIRGQEEIEVLGITFGEHPLARLDDKVSKLSELPEEPEVANIFFKDGREIPIYKLHILAGSVIAKDKQHHIITLLTTEGPIDVKFTKEAFANYDSQVSVVVNGTKKIIERSWFTRGTNLFICGLKRDGMFFAKKYRKSAMKHTVYKITDIDENGKPTYKTEREVGKVEESNGEE